MGLCEFFLNGGVLPLLISQGFCDGQSLFPQSLSFCLFPILRMWSFWVGTRTSQKLSVDFSISPKTRPTHRRHVVSIISADQRRLPEPLDFDVSGDIDLPAFLENAGSLCLTRYLRLGVGSPWVFLGNPKSWCILWSYPASEGGHWKGLRAGGLLGPKTAGWNAWTNVFPKLESLGCLGFTWLVSLKLDQIEL